MKKFVADESFWQLFPGAAIGVLAVEGLSAQPDGAKAAEIEAFLQQANAQAKRHLTSETISENAVVAVWRQAYQKFPTKKGARCSVEALLKRVLHDNPVGSIAPTVDITNAISLKYALPIGAENLAAIQGDLRLGTVQGGEDFLPIGGEKPEPPLPGELAYYDDAGIVCRCWNWRDGQRTAVQEDTDREFIAMECVDPARQQELAAAVEELAGLLSGLLGARVLQKQIITAQNREAVLEP